MIYVLTYSRLIPGTPAGYIGDLLETAADNLNKAERAFQNMPLDSEYFRKELWAINADNGRRQLMKEERFS